MRHAFPLVVVTGLASAQSATVWFEAPDETYTGDIDVEVWASWTTGASHTPPALASFGLDVGLERNHGGTVIAGEAQINRNLLLDSSRGVHSESSLIDVKGGQLANLFGFANPMIDRSHPILLFSFPMTLGMSQPGDMVEIFIQDVDPIGGIVIYPDEQSGDTIAFPNDGPLHLESHQITYVPGPMTGALLGGLVAWSRRRRR